MPIFRPGCIKKMLCYTFAVIVSKLFDVHLQSYLIFAVIGYTSLPSSKHVGQNKDITVFSIRDTLCTNWKNQWLFTKTANVYTIIGIVHHSTLDIPWSTEGQLKMLGSGIVLMMTPKSNLSRHRSKCAGPTGMHQSAEPIKDSFHWSSTPLLTLCLVVRDGRSVACQLLIVWLNWVTLSCFLYCLPWKWH